MHKGDRTNVRSRAEFISPKILSFHVNVDKPIVHERFWIAAGWVRHFRRPEVKDTGIRRRNLAQRQSRHGHFLADDCVLHINPGGSEDCVDVQGIEGARNAIAMVRAAFSDIRFTDDDTMVDGDMVVSRGTRTGTHPSEFRGIALTGKPVKFIGINIFRLRDGKIVELWAVEDAFTRSRQPGAFAR
jgi:predicted ester cyclase